jgi:hypothetical protein
VTIGPDAVPALRQALRSRCSWVRQGVNEVLRRMRKKEKAHRCRRALAAASPSSPIKRRAKTASAMC